MMPRPTWRQVRQFCETQGYERGEGDHPRFIKPLPDGSSSGTMFSHGNEGADVPANLWKLVWQRQLRLASEDEFRKGLDGMPVRYATPPAPEPESLLRPYQERFLRETLHYSDEAIAATMPEEARQLLDAHYARSLLSE
jgi:hypothetical protein